MIAQRKRTLTPSGKEAREIGDSGFCWQSKTALQKIRDSFQETNNASSVLLVYLALTEIASDNRSPAFLATQKQIAERACVSRSTVNTCLNNLTRIGLIESESTGFRKANRYFLNKPEPLVSNGCTLQEAVLVSNGCTPIKKGIEQRNKNVQNRGASGMHEAAVIPVLDEVLQHAKQTGHSPESARAFFEINQRRGWKTRTRGVDQPIRNWKLALDAFAQADQWRINPSDSVSNEDFWQSIREKYGDTEDLTEAANRWIRFMGKKQWMMADPITGTPLPVRDSKAVFGRWYESVWLNDDSLRAKWGGGDD